jgi:serine/threonine protein kinase
VDPLRARIIDELESTGRTPEEKLATIRATARGNVVQVMRRQGVEPAHALSAACRGAEIPPARAEWLRRPLSPKSHGIAPELCWKLLAAPLAREDGVLCIAFADPEVASVGTSLWGLPRHVPHLALEEHLRAVLKATIGGPGGGPVTGPEQTISEERSETLPAAPPAEVEENEVVHTDEIKATNSEIDDFAEGAPTVAYDGSFPLPEAARPPEAPKRPKTPSQGVGVRVGTGNVSVLDASPLEEIYQPIGDVTSGDETEVDEDDRFELTDPEGATGFTGDFPVANLQAAADFDAVAMTDPEAALPQHGGIQSYSLLRELGEGGMAQVFLAERKSDRVKVALKVMDPTLARDPKFVERFLREFEATNALNHPNVVRVVDDRCLEAGTYFMATEWIEGGTLRDLMRTLSENRKSYQPLVPAALVVEILAQCLEGLGAAHRRSIIHRDLKPVNLMINSDGQIKVVDFGIAKDLKSGDLTRAGVLFGTPMYMAPEQVQGEDLDARCDLFALGTLCLEMLSGENPFDDDNMQRSLLLVSQGTAPCASELVPGVPPLLDEVIARLMRPDPRERYSSAEEARAALEPLVACTRAARPGALDAAVHNPRRTRNELLALEADGHREAGDAAAAAGRFTEAVYRYGCACLARADDDRAHAALDDLTRAHRIPLGDLAHLPRERVAFEKSSAKQGLADSNTGRGVLTALAWARRGQLAGLKGADERYIEIVGDDPLVPLGDMASAPAPVSRSRDDIAALRRAAVEGGKGRPLAVVLVALFALAVIVALGVIFNDDDDEPEEPKKVQIEDAPSRSALAEGERLLLRGRAKEAIEKLSPIVDDEYLGVDARLLRAKAYRQLGDKAASRSDLQSIVDGTKPDDKRHQEAQVLLRD